jgi:hypothetical protein
MPIIPENAQALFSEKPLDELIQNQIVRARINIEETHPEDLLRTPVEDQVEVLVAEYQLVVPTLTEGAAYTDDPIETSVELNDYGRQVRVRATRYRTHIPFTGHQGLFHYYPAIRSFQAPEATIGQGEIVITLVAYDTPAAKVSVEDLNEKIETTVEGIKQFLAWQHPKVGAGNIDIREKIRIRIEERRAHILTSRNMAASLKYPLRRRPDASLTYTAPELRRAVTPPSRRASALEQQYTPEHAEGVPARLAFFRSLPGALNRSSLLRTIRRTRMEIAPRYTDK